MNKSNATFVGVVSAALISAVSLYEGTRTKPYEDVVGVLTVCTGHTGPDVVKGATYTPAQCKALLDTDLKAHREGVYNCVNKPMTSYQFDAFTMFTYNVGVRAFCTSKGVLGNFNAGNTKASCDGLLQWVYADGKRVQGLYNRRVYERKMCLGELENGK